MSRPPLEPRNPWVAPALLGALLAACSDDPPPSADAGPDQAVDEGESVTLTGSGTDPEGQPLALRWRQRSGPAVDLQDASTAQARFAAPATKAPVTLSFELRVEDPSGNTAEATTTVNVRPVNAPPAASIEANPTVIGGRSFQLLARPVDEDGAVTGFAWRQTAGPSATLARTAGRQIEATAPEVDARSDIGFEVQVTDDEGATATATVGISVVPANPDPVADAGPDRRGITAEDPDNPEVGEIVFLTPASSEGASFAWRITQSPDGAQARLTSPSTPVTGFYGDTPGIYRLELTVSNGQDRQATDDLVVTLVDDRDGDGLPDGEDLDRDGDGFLNADDAFPDDRAAHADANGDGVPNAREADVDADGTPDIVDAFPLDPARSALPVHAEQRETRASNQNDGVSVAEPAGAAPLAISGRLASSGGTTDLDYFAVELDAGRYAVRVEGAAAEMRPTAAVIDAAGAAVPSARLALDPAEPATTGIGIRVPRSGSYYLVVADASGDGDPTWGYRVEIVPDRDLDGLADDLERALESHHLTSDSDGDGLGDYVEARLAFAAWTARRDQDGDGLPPWWDRDTDGDWIPDPVEHEVAAPALGEPLDPTRNDADADGNPNFLDTDSDGNELATDFEEAGPDPIHPQDTDADGRPDYRDLDDDGDGLPDRAEGAAAARTPLPFAAMQPGAPRLLEARNLSVAGAAGVCRAGDRLEIAGADLPTSPSAAWVVFNTLDGAILERPARAEADAFEVVCPAGIRPGEVELFVAAGGARTRALALLVVAQDAPVLAEARFDAQRRQVILQGASLDANLTLQLRGASAPVRNARGRADEARVRVPAAAESGPVYVTGARGDSNPVPLVLTEPVTGRVTPVGPVDVTRLEVGFGFLDVATPASDGRYRLPLPRGEPGVVTAVLERSGSTDAAPGYALQLAALRLPGDASVDLDADSTALALVWMTLGVDRLVADVSLREARRRLEALSAVGTLRRRLTTSLSRDPEVLANPSADAAFSQALRQAVEAGAREVGAGLADGTLVRRGQPAVGANGIFGPPADVTPPSADDITVFERGDTGHLTVENDTPLFLSIQVTAGDGQRLRPHTTSLSGMAGPRGGAFLSLFDPTGATELDVPGGANARMEIITAGVDGTGHEPRVSLPGDPRRDGVWEMLFLRTMVQQVLYPLLTETLGGTALDGRQVANGLLTYAPSVVASMLRLAEQGDVAGAAGVLVTALRDDLTTYPPGPVARAVYGGAARRIGARLLRGAVARFGSRAIPIFGQVLLALDVLDTLVGIASTGYQTLSTVNALETTDSIIDFDVRFLLELTEVVPSQIQRDGTDRQVELRGSGFGPILESRRPFPLRSALPRVTLSDAGGTAQALTMEIPAGRIDRSGTSMQVTIPGAWLEQATGPVDVRVEHPDASAQLREAIQLIDGTVVTSIDPARGGAGTAAVVRGAGFGPLLTDNEVQIGGRPALVTAASESRLGVVIPPDLPPGTHEVRVRARRGGAWSPWAGGVRYEVLASQVSIRVCDNGSAKDDAFALYVDGLYLGTMNAARGPFCETYRPFLDPGPHTAMLVGIEAPDSVGTYSVTFSGVTGLSGDARSGSDLVPGVRKRYAFEVSTRASTSAALTTAPYTPPAHDPEALD